MGNTSQNVEKEDPGYRDMTVNKLEWSIGVIEEAMREIGMCPKDEFMKLTREKGGEKLARQIANIFARKNPNAASTWEHAWRLFGEENSRYRPKDKIFTPDDWEKFFNIKLRISSPREIDQVSHFPWRAKDLDQTGVNTDLVEWRSSFAFLSPTNSEMTKLLLIEIDRRIKWDDDKLFQYTGRAVINTSGFEWCLMPDEQCIELSGDENSYAREALVPKGYKQAGLKDVLLFVSGNILKGNNLYLKNKTQFVCEQFRWDEKPLVIDVTISDGDGLETRSCSFDFMELSECQNIDNLILPIKKNFPRYYNPR